MRAHRNSPRSTLAIAAAVLASLCGCLSPPQPIELTLASLQPGAVDAQTLRQGVTGEWCFTQDVISNSLRPPWRVRLADTGRAVSEALASVEGANVLTNVTVRTRIEQYLLFQRVCSVVVGDAGWIR
jgi:hypothetical protein